MQKPECPCCEKEITTLLYVEYGRKIRDGKQWQEDEGYGDIKFHCPECDTSIDYDDLAKLELKL